MRNACADAILIALVCTILSACGGSGAFTNAARPLTPFRPASAGKIQHVVIIIQENRSFNNLFAGYPGAKTREWGYNTSGHKVRLKAIGLATTWDIEHNSAAFFSSCNGTGSIRGTDCRMNGFNNESVGCKSHCPTKYPQYAYVPRAEIKPYWAIARQYVLADQMYSSNFDGSSFVSHQYIIAGQAESSVNYPHGAWGCRGGPGDHIWKVGPQRQIPDGTEEVCWDATTLGDELDAGGISWAYYAETSSGYSSRWNGYQVIKHIYDGSDWKKDMRSPPSQILKDVGDGQLRTVSWVTPTGANSDHAGFKSKTGPDWVASVVNIIGESKYWDSSAIFIFWDDYGGWYDPEPPAYVDYDGLGFRLPMLIVSPYAKKGYVSHVHYEHGSILKFVEDQFGLAQLAVSDARANSPEADAFDFNQPPRKFKIIPTTLDAHYFLQQPPDYRIPDNE